jgi:hypothetical protein
VESTCRERTSHIVLSRYVDTYCEHHIAQCWWGNWEADSEAISWLDDFIPQIQQDAIPLAAARFLGTERASQLAKASERTCDWWSASLRWSVTALSTRNTTSHGAALPLFKAAAAALERVQPATWEAKCAKERLELPTLVCILNAWEKENIPVYSPRLQALTRSIAASENVTGCAQILLMSEIWPDFMAVKRNGCGSLAELNFGKLVYKFCTMYVDALLREEPGSRRRAQLLVLTYTFNHGTCFIDLMLEAVPEFDWDKTYGTGGCLLTEASEAYDFSSMHTAVKTVYSWDGNVRPTYVMPLFVRWGDLQGAGANVDRGLGVFKQMMADSAPDAATWLICIMEWPVVLHLMGRSADAVAFMRQSRCLVVAQVAQWHR